MSRSILQGCGPDDGDKARCYLCRKPGPLERHHVFQGPNRSVSEREGCWVFLCRECHHDRVHAHRRIEVSGLGMVDAMEFLHMTCQVQWMHDHDATIADFRAVFGRSWLP